MILTAALLAGCGGDGDGSDEEGRYSAEVRSDFLDACQRPGVSKSVCESALRCLEDRFSEAEFVAESEKLGSEAASEEFVEAMTSCADPEAPAGPALPETPGA